MMKKAFHGLKAIAPPDWKKPRREVFGIKPDFTGDTTELYREKARLRHPNAGGNDTLMAELNPRPLINFAFGFAGAIPSSTMSRLRTRGTSGHIEPCLPSPAERPPSGDGWLHEIKHDGFRIMARREGAGVRLITRHGNDFTNRFPLAAAAINALPGRSFLIDGEAIVTDDRGLAVFDLIRHKRHGDDAVLIAFDLIELDGEDLRRTPIEQRKRTLAKLVRRPHAGIVLNEVFEGDGDILFAHACKLGCEGIVSKRLGSLYRSGRSPHWLKVKNPKAPAVTREAEEDWGR